MCWMNKSFTNSPKTGSGSVAQIFCLMNSRHTIKDTNHSYCNMKRYLCFCIWVIHSINNEAFNSEVPVSDSGKCVAASLPSVGSRGNAPYFTSGRHSGTAHVVLTEFLFQERLKCVLDHRQVLSSICIWEDYSYSFVHSYFKKFSKAHNNNCKFYST